MRELRGLLVGDLLRLGSPHGAPRRVPARNDDVRSILLEARTHTSTARARAPFSRACLHMIVARPWFPHQAPRARRRRPRHRGGRRGGGGGRRRGRRFVVVLERARGSVRRRGRQQPRHHGQVSLALQERGARRRSAAGAARAARRTAPRSRRPRPRRRGSAGAPTTPIGAARTTARTRRARPRHRALVRRPQLPHLREPLARADVRSHGARRPAAAGRPAQAPAARPARHRAAAEPRLRRLRRGALTFPPTYKYIPGQNRYDRRPEKKMRCPAWCDRVLWRGRAARARRRRRARPTRARPSSSATTGASRSSSRTLPVLSVFDVRVRHIDEAARARVCGEVAAAAAATRRPALVALDAPPAGGAASAGDYAATAPSTRSSPGSRSPRRRARAPADVGRRRGRARPPPRGSRSPACRTGSRSPPRAARSRTATTCR